MQETEIRIIDDFPLLTLPHRGDGDADLLAELIDLVRVEIGHAGVRIEDRLDLAQVIFARILLIIDESCRQQRRCV